MKNNEDLAQLIAKQNQQLWDLKVLINEVQCENQDLKLNQDETHNIVLLLKRENQRFKDESLTLKNSLEVALNSLVLLKEENQTLKDEIATLKGQKPRPKIPPSTLEGPKDPDRQKNNTSRGKHPRHKKTSTLEIHARSRIKPESIPAEATFKGLQKVVVQDIILQPHNTVYELERWMLPNGTYITGQLPQNIRGHYGPQVKAYILHQYYGCRVTEPLLFAQLKEIGILISAGKLNNILIQNKDTFHAEKDSLLRAGIAATEQIKVDDAGARHKGQNGYSNVIGNEFFTSIVTTSSKSRINFLQILHGNNPQYLINEDAVNYIANLKPESWLLGYLFLHGTNQSMNQEEFNQFLMTVNITKESDVRIATEGALFASLIRNGVPKNLGVHGDDAGQFNAFVRSLCWIHEERHYRKLIPFNDEAREAIDEVRGELWDLYKGLKEYKLAPSEAPRALLEQKFEDLFFKKRTISRSLNEQLAKTYAKKEELLRVLERPETPLHNNPTETDAREMVVKKKVSGGTRSDEGRKCRDTFVSLKRTCIKLGINFLSYLNDRVAGASDIPDLAQVIATSASMQPKRS